MWLYLERSMTEFDGLCPMAMAAPDACLALDRYLQMVQQQASCRAVNEMCRVRTGVHGSNSSIHYRGTDL